MAVKQEPTRLLIECAWCRKKQTIPFEWAGRVITCLHCGIEGRAYGYLTPPKRVAPPEPNLDIGYMLPVDEDAYDCRGGLIAGLIVGAGCWVLLGAMVWRWL